MAHTDSPHGGGHHGGGTGGPAHRLDIDWMAAEQSPEFQELVRRRRGFVYPATAFFMLWYFGFILLASLAPDFMGESVIEGLTVGYVLALTQFIMTWVLGWMYLRAADRVFDPLARRAAEAAIEAGADRGRTGAGATAAQAAPVAGSGEVAPR